MSQLTVRATVQKFMVASQFIDVLKAFEGGPGEEVSMLQFPLTPDGAEVQVLQVESSRYCKGTQRGADTCCWPTCCRGGRSSGFPITGSFGLSDRYHPRRGPRIPWQC